MGFKKKDLEDGDIVVLKDGIRYVCFEDYLTNKDRSYPLYAYSEKMECKHTGKYDIAKVQRNGQVVFEK